MAYLQANQIGFRDTTVRVTVPDNDVARLMYYLNCLCEAIYYDDNDIQRYRNYNSWHLLNETEITRLLVLCLHLSPDIFNNKVFFHSDELCGDMRNRFFEIKQVKHQLFAAEAIVIAGQTHHVNKIMTYKMSWMKYFYIDPIQRLSARIKSRSQSARTYRPVQQQSSSCTIL